MIEISEKVQDLNKKFLEGIESTMQITELNYRILDIASESLDSIGHLANKLGGNAVQNQKRTLGRMKNNPEINNTLAIIHGQQVVLLVSSFETYMKDIVRLLGNECPQVFRIPQDTAKIDLSELLRPSTTRGDIILNLLLKQDINFQDLQAVKRFFNERLGIELEIESEFEYQFILMTAIRHIIVHSSGIITSEFMKQIRNLPDETKATFKQGQLVNVSQEDVVACRDALVNIGDIAESATVGVVWAY